jgi:hypothetical protein
LEFAHQEGSPSLVVDRIGRSSAARTVKVYVRDYQWESLPAMVQKVTAHLCYDQKWNRRKILLKRFQAHMPAQTNLADRVPRIVTNFLEIVLRFR